jgi:hypothetical protein
MVRINQTITLSQEAEARSQKRVVATLRKIARTALTSPIVTRRDQKTITKGVIRFIFLP